MAASYHSGCHSSPSESTPQLPALRAQLLHEPMVETRNRKRMDPDRRTYVAPWELRVGQLRVYHAVKEEAALVVVTKIGIKDRDRVIIGGESFEL